jgi:calcium-dependent protein kinase
VIDEDEPFTKNYTWGEQVSLMQRHDYSHITLPKQILHLLSQIGIGTFSVVHEVTFIKTNKLFAAKQVSRKDLHPSDAVALHDEISALQQVTDCEHIVKLYDVYDEPDYTVLVMECMGGGDLIDRIIEKRHYTEFDAKEVSRKLILGVAHCHKRRIANRNVKPESLLLVRSESVGWISHIYVSLVSHP